MRLETSMPVFYQYWGGSLNRDATAGATADDTAITNSIAAKKTWIFKSFSESPGESPDATNDRSRWF